MYRLRSEMKLFYLAIHKQSLGYGGFCEEFLCFGLFALQMWMNESTSEVLGDKMKKCFRECW